MKIANFYSIFDQASGLYSQPALCDADPQAIREFTDLVANADTSIGKHPSDYTLFRIGRFNDTTAAIIPEQLTKMITGLEALASIQKIDHGKQADLVDEINNYGGTD